jgi:maleylacetate reductase
MKKISRALGGAPAAQGLYELAKKNGAPVSLKELGLAVSDLDKASHIAMQNPYWNPRPIGMDSVTAIRRLLQNAWEGVSPVDSLS